MKKIDGRVKSGASRYRINIQTGPKVKQALRVAMAVSGLTQYELLKDGIAAAIKRYAPEYVDDVRKEMGVSE